MSEEEIIEYLEEIIDFLKDDDYMLRAGIDNEFVEGLLDLYTKEKEKVDRLQKELENKQNKKYKDKKEANRVWWNAHKDERNEKRRLQRKENKEQINAEIRKKRAEDIDYRDKKRYYCFKFNHKNDDKRNYTFEEWKKYVENKAKKQIKEIPLLEDLLKENKIYGK